ncbi:MAG: hypothetical protein WAW75_10070, partial [Gallionella sp.]
GRNNQRALHRMVVIWCNALRLLHPTLALIPCHTLNGGKLMQTAIEYLDKTESAMRKLFEGIDSYFAPLRRSQSLTFESSTVDDGKRRVEREIWLRQNMNAIMASFVDQREFVAESFAQTVLCGAVLQVAAKAIGMYSENAIVPSEWQAVPSISKAVKFCYGRPVCGIPLGLIIYAGRNQHTHFEDAKLYEPNKTVFERLATRNSNAAEAQYCNPAFDLANDRLISFASNIMSLIEWDTYEAYSQDIRPMLGLKN